jgi:hypothetical protein
MKNAIVAVLLLVLLGACQSTTTNPVTPPPQTPPQAQLRFYHALFGRAGVDIFINDTLRSPGVTFDSLTAYRTLGVGSTRITATATGTITTVSSATLPLAANQKATVVIADPASTSPIVLTDTAGASTSGQAWVRFVHAIPGNDTVSIAVSIVGQPATNVNRLTFARATHYFPLAANSAGITATNTANIVLGNLSTTFAAGRNYTVILRGSSASPNIRILNE